MVTRVDICWGPDGPRASPGGVALERPVFYKTGIDSHSDDGFNSVAVAAAVCYEL